MTQLKEPLQSQIMTGYQISKAVGEGSNYINHSLECLDQAISDSQAAGDDVYLTQVATAKRKLYNALAGLQEAKEAHEILRLLMVDYGYRAITDADFEVHGAGGKR